MSHWLDDVARQLAQGGVSRRSLLRRLGAGTVVGVVAALGRRSARVEAQVAPTRRCLIGAAPNTTYGCLTGQTCCPTVDVQGVCCPAGTLCPPPGNPAGPVCAVCPAGTMFCTALPPLCCPATTTCINGACCPNAQVCVTPGGLVCCPSGQSCCTGACCATGQCCNGVCCASGQTCLNGACCANAQVCGSVCCPAGQTCVAGACCPTTQVCNGGTVCCPAHQVCIGGTMCGCLPCSTTVLNGSLTAGDPQESPRLGVFGGPNSSCAAPTTCPATIGGTFAYDAYTFQACAAGCVTVDVTSSGPACLLQTEAYLGSFDPTTPCTNFLAHIPFGFGGSTESYSFNVAAGSQFVVVVNENDSGGGCSSYGLAVSCGTLVSSSSGAASLRSGTTALPVLPAGPGRRVTDR